ncbi:MAG: redoxin family protein [Alphaproteobacteria bacterium]
MNRLIYVLPFITLFYLGYAYFQEKTERSTPQMIERVVPYFEYPEILSKTGNNTHLSNSTLANKPIMINIFASWCPTCQLEHDQLMALAEMDAVDIYGIAYRDKEYMVEIMMKRDGNPYKRIALDEKGTSIHAFQARGTPQSYIIDQNGIIRYHHKGPISKKTLYSHILPAIEKVSGSGIISN